MPTQRFDDIGRSGLVTDLHPAATDGWQACRNVVPRNNKIATAQGQTKLFDLAIAPRWHTTHRQPDGTDYLIVCDGTNVWAYTMDGVGEDITYAIGGGARPFSDSISFCALNSVLVWNSLAAGPFYWPGPGDVLTPLPGWNADWRCKTMAAYRYYLVAGGMVDDRTTVPPTYYPHKIRWSTSAADGEIPSEWTAAPTNEAGDDLLGETSGEILGMTPVQDSLWIIKSDAVYTMDWVGIPFIMQVRRLRGALNLHGAQETAEYLGSLVAMSGRDVVVFDGAQVRSLVKGKVELGLKDLIGSQDWASGRVFIDSFINRLYVLGQATGTDQFTKALVLDLNTQAWGEIDLQYVYGLLNIPYARSPLDPKVVEVIALESAEDNFAWWVSVLDDSASTSVGVPLPYSVEHYGLPIEGAPGLAMITEAWVEATGEADTLQAYIGAQWELDDAIRWDGPHTVTPNRGTRINPLITGRYFAFKFESQGRQNWEIGSLTLRWSPAGER